MLRNIVNKVWIIKIICITLLKFFKKLDIMKVYIVNIYIFSSE